MSSERWTNEIKPEARLTRVVPQRTESHKVLWLKKDFMLYGTFRAVREKSKMQVQKTCFWCREPFKDSEMLALACLEKKGNKLLCQTCISSL